MLRAHARIRGIYGITNINMCSCHHALSQTHLVARSLYTALRIDDFKRSGNAECASPAGELYDRERMVDLEDLFRDLLAAPVRKLRPRDLHTTVTRIARGAEANNAPDGAVDEFALHEILPSRGLLNRLSAEEP